jgi:hypothetical protein
MAERAMAAELEAQIGQWRSFLDRRPAIRPQDVAELEDHLRDQVETLRESGLSDDEAFLVAVKRMGAQDAISNEFAREHSERLWKQLVMSPANDAAPDARARTEMIVVLALAVMAAIAIKLPWLFGHEWGGKDTSFYARNIAFFVLPMLAGYFAWKRGLGQRTLMMLAAGFAVAVFVANLFPFEPKSSTFVLTVLHLPIALWLLVGIAYAGNRWRESGGRMDFVRFSGELLIYYSLIALGGGVLTAITVGMFQAIGIDPEKGIEHLLPSAAAGAVIVAAWLVEAKKSVIENMAPVLTRLFTPLFAITLLAFLGTMVLTGRGIDIERNALIAFDVQLVLVLGLLLYSISARDRDAPPAAFDLLLVLLVAAALAADAFALLAIASRISEFGFTPNRVAALGFNIILLVNLAWSAVLYARFLRGRGAFATLERWQTAYLPVYSIWATLVVIVFPPMFGFK